MDDAQLNEAVARKLGYVIYETNTYAGGTARYAKSVKETFEIPDSATSIAAAWEVVEHLKNHAIALTSHTQPPHGWSCAIWSPMTEDPDVVERADTAPRAICEAFLKLDVTAIP